MNIPQKVIYCSYISNLIGYLYFALESQLFMSRDFFVVDKSNCTSVVQFPLHSSRFLLFSQMHLSICAAHTEINF